MTKLRDLCLGIVLRYSDAAQLSFAVLDVHQGDDPPDRYRQYHAGYGEEQELLQTKPKHRLLLVEISV